MFHVKQSSLADTEITEHCIEDFIYIDPPGDQAERPGGQANILGNQFGQDTGRSPLKRSHRLFQGFPVALACGHRTFMARQTRLDAGLKTSNQIPDTRPGFDRYRDDR